MNWLKVFSRTTMLGLILLNFSCDKNRIMDVNEAIDENGWEISDVKKFNFSISDTSLMYNFYINVRNTSSYEYNNLYLYFEMTSPTEKFFLDTVEVVLADNTGRWVGSGIGNVWQNQVSLMTGVRLKEMGQYSISIRHGMRKALLENISDIGVRVEKI